MSDIRNASHRAPPFFEWWYFHFVTPDGAALNMVLHETDILGQNADPYLSMSILLPGQSPVYLRRELRLETIAQEQTFLHVKDPLIIEDEKGIFFDIPFPGQGHFKGWIIKLSPPLVFQDSILYQDTITGRTSHWVVQVPHGSFTALLQVGEALHHLKGMAYQDHQWGSTLLQESVADWVWGHFSNEHMAVLFFQILTQHGQMIERVAMLTNEGRFTGTVLETIYLATLFSEHKPSAFTGPVTVSFLEQSLRVEFDLSPDNLMRSRLDEQHGQKKISYLRWASRATYQGACGQQPLYGISEYIRVRLTGYEKLSQREHREYHLRHDDGGLLGDSPPLSALGAPAAGRESGG
jgi:hypothetical protein